MTMEKLKRRFNTSPIIRKKGAQANGYPGAGVLRGDGSGNLKTFGASLEELALRERSDVPLIVRKICEYVLDRGLSVEGLFRINGNVRLIQSLMATYDAEGDVDLSDCNDVHSVAGLLKRFVRDLSDGLIPERLTADFIKAVEEFGESDNECISEVQKLLNLLSHESYSTLRYLCFFLWEVSQREAENKMSAGSLGIVFGPNVFRCGDNCMTLGLSLSYTHCNRAMSIMISHCHRVFDHSEPGCLLPHKSGHKAVPPPRPPPPNLPSSRDSSRLHPPPQPSWCRTQSEEPRVTPRANSPFLQDNSETECSLSRDFVSGPPAPGVSNVIHYVISDSIFGEYEAEENHVPSPKPRKRRVGFQCSLPHSGQASSSENVSLSEKEKAPLVTPRRRRDKAGGSEVNNLPGSHSLPELLVNGGTHSPSEGDHSIAEVTTRATAESDEDRSLGTVQDLRRQIQTLKRQVRRFEEDFLTTHGHKPSMSEKNANKEVRAYLSDLASCRRRLRTLQDGSDESEPVNKLSARSRSVDSLAANGSHEDVSPQPKTRIMKPLVVVRNTRSQLEMALEELEHELQVKRELSGRPENLHAMTLDQVKEEKSTLQRALLNHESRYGRPQTLREKEVMRPVYDRYRTVKRHLSEVRHGDAPDSVMVESLVAGSNDVFAVTQDFQSRMRREGLMTSSLIHTPDVPTSGVRRRVNGRGTENRAKRFSQPIMPSNVAVAESSTEHLLEEQGRLLSEKKELQRQLKHYERQFEEETGRKPDKEDRKPMHSEYVRYKHIKSRLKEVQLRLL